MRSTATAAPPAWVWVASLALALAGLAASLPAFLAHEQAAARPADLMRDGIENFAATPRRGAWRVIAIGDSALGTATPQRAEMADYSRRTRDLDLDYLRLWRPWCQLHQVLPALTAAIDARPDVVMLDSWSLLYALDRYAAEAYRKFHPEDPPSVVAAVQRLADEPSAVLDHQAFLFDRITGATAGQVRLPLAGGAKRRPGDQLRCDEAARRRVLHMVGLRNPDTGEDATVDPMVRQALEMFLDRAAARGVRFVFFDIPKAPVIEALPGVRSKRAATRDLLQGFVRQGRAEYLEYSAAIEDADTCDYVHLSERGHDRYLAWFVDELARLHAKEQAR